MLTIITVRKVLHFIPAKPAATVEISAKAGAGLASNKILTPNFFATSSDLSKSSLLSIFFAKDFASYFPIINPVMDPNVSPAQITGIDK